MIALLWLACSTPAPVAQAPVPAPPATRTPEDLAFQRAEQLLDRADQRLQTRMVQAMGRHPEEVCSIEEDALTSAPTTADVGAQVGRASLRLRNPSNTGPDWVRTWLDSVGEKPATPPQGFRRVDDTPNGKVARVLRPIVMTERCIACHGPPDTLAADVRATLHQQYPDDRATGYAVGDLRGAMWAEIPIAGRPEAAAGG